SGKHVSFVPVAAAHVRTALNYCHHLLALPRARSKIQTTLDASGIETIPADDGKGPGVRLRKPAGRERTGGPFRRWQRTKPAGRANKSQALRQPLQPRRKSVSSEIPNGPVPRGNDSKIESRQLS